MKKLFTSLFLLAGVIHGNAQITWSTPVVVAGGSTYGYLHPRIALNRAGNPMILWGKNDTRAYFSRWTGSAFSAPVAVGNTAINVFAQSWAGPEMTSSGDTVYVVMKRTPETTSMNHIYMSHSYNGGMSFSDTVRVDNIDTSLSRFPTVTTNSSGNPIVGFMKFNASFGDAKYVVSRSADHGLTFSADALASGMAGDVCDCCPASVISSGSDVVMLFRNNLSNIREMWAGVSTDGGATFPSALHVDTTNWMIMSCPASGPDGLIIGDTLYSVFMSTGSGTALVNFGRASISAMSARHSRITGSFSGLSSQNYPRIASANSAAIAVWKQNTSSGNAIAYSFTPNIHNGFSGYNTITGSTGSGVVNADVAMTPGFIHVVWEDDNTTSVMYAVGTYPTTGVKATAQREVIDIYPNPANETVSVSLKNIGKPGACYLTDNAGRNIELQPEIVNGIATFSLGGVAKGGYYFVILDEAGNSFYSKLVVQ